jgi:hypothetical protein
MVTLPFLLIVMVRLFAKVAGCNFVAGIFSRALKLPYVIGGLVTLSPSAAVCLNVSPGLLDQIDDRVGLPIKKKHVETL